MNLTDRMGTPRFKRATAKSWGLICPEVSSNGARPIFAQSPDQPAVRVASSIAVARWAHLLLAWATFLSLGSNRRGETELKILSPPSKPPNNPSPVRQGHRARIFCCAPDAHPYPRFGRAPDAHAHPRFGRAPDTPPASALARRSGGAASPASPYLSASDPIGHASMAMPCVS